MSFAHRLTFPRPRRSLNPSLMAHDRRLTQRDGARPARDNGPGQGRKGIAHRNAGLVSRAGPIYVRNRYGGGRRQPPPDANRDCTIVVTSEVTVPGMMPRLAPSRDALLTT